MKYIVTINTTDNFEVEADTPGDAAEIASDLWRTTKTGRKVSSPCPIIDIVIKRILPE